MRLISLVHVFKYSTVLQSRWNSVCRFASQLIGPKPRVDKELQAQFRTGGNTKSSPLDVAVSVISRKLCQSDLKAHVLIHQWR